MASPHHLKHLRIPFELNREGDRRSQNEFGNADAIMRSTVLRLKGNLNLGEPDPAVDGFRALSVSITRLGLVAIA